VSWEEFFNSLFANSILSTRVIAMRAWLAILASIIAVWVLQIAVPLLTGFHFTEFFWLDPSMMLQHPWSIITSAFLHQPLSIWHIFFNSFALFSFGPYLEQRIGTRNFLIVYFGSAIFGALSYLLTIWLGIIPSTPALGASGAIYGILGALAILVPQIVVFVFFAPMPIRFAAVFWFVMEFLGSFNGASGIGSAAHLGGLVFGLAFGYYYLKKGIETQEWFVQM
jgi:membrane associated rhomboid family serine protease